MANLLFQKDEEPKRKLLILNLIYKSCWHKRHSLLPWLIHTYNSPPSPYKGVSSFQGDSRYVKGPRDGTLLTSLASCWTSGPFSASSHLVFFLGDAFSDSPLPVWTPDPHLVISFYDKEILSNLKRERKTAQKQTVILKGAFYNLSLSVLLK